ncbi:toxic anion resistance protein [Acinetobacter indicus]|uniref:toxic anion resistance protein n=1 Tax=Acinetobacter TaxID=469 RepID=UPI0015D45FF0|nr:MULTISPECIES: toxic anion resistance protein [Acinetobacter]MCP0917711.1 toxic anion resistance protein [Acinetobacter indicus]
MKQKNEITAIEIDSKDIEAALNAIEENKGIARNQILGPVADTLSSPETIARIASIKGKLDGKLSSSEVTKFGAEIGERTNSYTDDMLSQVNNSDLESLGGGLTDLVLSTQKHSQDALMFRERNQKSKIPLIGKYIDKYREKKEENKIMFETTKQSIDRMVDNLNVRQASIIKRNDELENMYHGVLDTAQEIGLYIISAQLRLGEMKAELIVLSGRNIDNSDKFLNQEIYDLNSAVNSLEKRIDDMYLLQQASFLTLPQIRIIQQNNRDLTDKFNVVKTITIPTWKNSYAMAISLKEQQNNIKLINAVDDHTNQLLKDLADQLQHNSIATAKANNRNAIDVETIEHVQQKLSETISEVLKIQQQGIIENRKAILRLNKNKGFAEAITLQQQQRKMPKDIQVVGNDA